MSIKLKLALILGFFSVLTGSVAFLNYKSSSNLSDSLANVATVQMPAVRNMTLVDMMHDGLRAIVYQAFYFSESGSEKDKEDVVVELHEFSKNMKEYLSILSGLKVKPETGAAIAEALPEVEKYIAVSNEIVELIVQNKKVEAKAKMPEFLTQFSALESKLETLGEMIEKDAADINSDGADTAKYMLVISIFGLFLGVTFGGFTTVSISRTLSEVFNEVKKTATELLKTSEDLVVSSHGLAAASEQEASAVEESSASLEEISGMVASAVRGAEQSVGSSKKVSELVASGTELMGELKNSVQMIADANKRVEHLVGLIEEIGDKTELIDEIVFQTRLLSFNASVEAERAGEHGRGFAVVAQEVGNLAQMSGKRASEIGQIVKNSIKEAREVVSVNKSKVEHGVQLSQKTSQQLLAIEGASGEILTNSELVLRSSQEQHAGVRQINESIQLISKSAQENATTSKECSKNSELLSQLGKNLTDAIGEIGKLVHGGGSAKKEFHPQPVEISVKKKNFESAPQFKSVGSSALKHENDPWEKL